MSKEDKELILTDLCARLPYDVMCQIDKQGKIYKLKGINKHNSIWWYEFDGFRIIIPPKPYLRPMSSMTNEEFVYFMGIRGKNLADYEIQHLKEDTFKSLSTITVVNTLQQYSSKLNWLAKNKFDYNGLIEKGLAIDMTKEH